MWSCGHVVVVVPRVEKDLGWSYMFYLGNLHDRLSQAIELRPQDVQLMPGHAKQVADLTPGEQPTDRDTSHSLGDLAHPIECLMSDALAHRAVQ